MSLKKMHLDGKMVVSDICGAAAQTCRLMKQTKLTFVKRLKYFEMDAVATVEAAQPRLSR
jgi:hypothetical protein